MKRYINVTNQKFNRLTAIKYLYTNKFRSAVWLFKCECGKLIQKNINTVKSGMTKSCGCLNNEVRHIKHFTEKELEEKRKREWKEYYKLHRKKLIKRVCKYQKKNRDYKKEYKRNKERKENDINYRLKINLRNRLLQALKSGQKGGSFIKNLGCSINELKNYLEDKFLDGMSWSNYGEWQIDHVIPLSLFNLTDKEEFKEAVHYSNLQPLWAKDNQSKGNNIQELGLIA